ncbi:hypothetical protein [Streptomyces flaveus]|uniref:hypothetical protein n=1 Tax=Streptomyces flaveus TaxID=66370 RepID=UPI00331A9011
MLILDAFQIVLAAFAGLTFLVTGVFSVLSTLSCGFGGTRRETRGKGAGPVPRERCFDHHAHAGSRRSTASCP